MARKEMEDICPNVQATNFFISFGSIIITLPPFCLASHLSLFWFFLPFGYLCFRYGVIIISDWKEMAKAQKVSYLPAFAVSSVMIKLIGYYIFALAPYSEYFYK